MDYICRLGCGVEWNKGTTADLPLADCNCKNQWLSSHVMSLGQDTLVPTQKLEDLETWQIEAWHLLPACGVFLFLEDPRFLAAVENRSPSRIRNHLN